MGAVRGEQEVEHRTKKRSPEKTEEEKEVAQNLYCALVKHQLEFPHRGLIVYCEPYR